MEYYTATDKHEMFKLCHHMRKITFPYIIGFICLKEAAACNVFTYMKFITGDAVNRVNCKYLPEGWVL